jgi:hypothetical protein
VFGSKLKEQVEDRLKFYETGLILFYIGIVSSGEPAGNESFHSWQVWRMSRYYSTSLNSENNEKNTSHNT